MKIECDECGYEKEEEELDENGLCEECRKENLKDLKELEEEDE